MQTTGPNFAALRQAIDFRDVLAHYRVKFRQVRDNELRAPCPIHGGDNPTAFAVYLDTNSWYCFTRGHGGDVIRFVAEMEETTAGNAARLLEDGFRLRPVIRPHEPPPTAGPRPPHITPPLDPFHEAVAGLGIDEDTAQAFGIGFCASGPLHGRVAFPIHDREGRVVSYCGRAAGNEYPKYKHLNHFRAGSVLYNLDRVTGERVVLVEGFRGVWALHRLNLPVGASMGAHLTPIQAGLLERFRLVVVLFDGDQAGREGARQAVDRLVRRTAVRVVELPNGKQPDTVGEEWLTGALLA